MSESQGNNIVIQAEPIRMKRVEAARFLGISPRQLQRLVSLGHIGYVLDTDNGERLFLTAELRRYTNDLPMQRESDAA